ncbi:hypothetical protein F4810DRAFT_27119 [Camillea tinctor]|nr:hypothetical protein F4810DRAFT_27119 [Camillea tinctor]
MEKMGTSIRELSLECDELFRKMTRSQQARSYIVVEVMHQLFEQWTREMNVYAKPHRSLDANLVYSDAVRDQFLQHLRSIQRNLQEVEDLENMPVDENEDIEDARAIADKMDPGHVGGISSPLVESLKALESVVDSMIRFGRVVQQSTPSILTQRISNFDQKNNDAPIEDTVYLHLKHRLVDYAQQQEKTQGATLSLCRQLAASISFRYCGVLYKRSHNAKKRGDRFTEDNPLANRNQELQPTKSAVKKSYTTEPKSFSGTKSAISVRISGDVKYPEAPKVLPPETCALCPLCFDYHDKSQLEARDWWERHVDEELRLYTCISEECLNPPRLFAQFDEWKEHMDSEHSLEWVRNVHAPPTLCCDMDHDELTFEGEVDLEQHVKDEHPEFGGPGLEILKGWCTITLPRPPHTCPICNSIPKELAHMLHLDKKGETTDPFNAQESHAELLRHIAQHLKKVGLITVRYLFDDDNNVGSRMSDEDNKKGLLQGEWVDGEWHPPVVPYLDDECKGFVADSMAGSKEYAESRAEDIREQALQFSTEGLGLPNYYQKRD